MDEPQQAMLIGLDDLRPAPTAHTRPHQLRVREVSTWARKQLRWIARRSGAKAHDEVFIYQQAAKLVEEIGELHAELLGRSKLQRGSKGQAYDSASLSGEFADVLICVAILAEAVGVDLEESLQSKMAFIDARVSGDQSLRQQA